MRPIIPALALLLSATAARAEPDAYAQPGFDATEIVAAAVSAATPPSAQTPPKPAPRPAAAVPPKVQDFIGTIQLADKERAGLERALAYMKKKYPREFSALREAAKKDVLVRGRIVVAVRIAKPQYRKDRIAKTLLSVEKNAAQRRTAPSAPGARGASPGNSRKPGAPPTGRPNGGGSSSPAAPGAAARRDSAEPPPAGVPKDVWDFVQSQRANIIDPDTKGPSPQRRGIAGQILAQIKQTDPAAYQALTAKLQSQGRAGFDAVLPQGGRPVQPGDIGALAAAAAAYARRPAAPSRGPVGPAAPSGPGTALNQLTGIAGNGAGGAGGAGVAPTVAPTESSRPGDRKYQPVNAIAALLKDDADDSRKKDVAQRLNELIWDGANSVSFVDAQLKAADAKLPSGKKQRTLDLAAVQKWVARNPGDAAKIYYILLKEPGPKWVEGQPVLGGAQFKDKLIQNLKRWSQTGADKFTSPDGVINEFPISPRSGTSAGQWVDAFLADAAKQADDILKASKQLPNKVAGDIARNRDGVNPPGAPPAPTGGAAQGGQLTSFGPQQLFGQWGDKDVLYLDGRLISVRLVTGKDPTTGRLMNKIAVFDVTNPSNVYGKTFDYNGAALCPPSGDPKGCPPGTIVQGFAPGQSFALDDSPRGDGTQPKQYTLQLVPNGDTKQVVLSLASGSKAQAVNAADYQAQQQGKQIQGVTVTDLDALRQQHTQQLGFTSTVDGTDYYVMPQSAGYGCYQYMDKQTLEPVMMGCVNQKVGGQEVPLDSVVQGYESLGQAVQPDGQTLHYYYLHLGKMPGNSAISVVNVDVTTTPRQSPQTDTDTSTGTGTDSGTGTDTGTSTAAGTGVATGTGTGTQTCGGKGPACPTGGPLGRADGWPDDSAEGYVSDAVGLPRGFNQALANQAAAMNAALSRDLAQKIRFYVFADPSRSKNPTEKWMLGTISAGQLFLVQLEWPGVDESGTHFSSILRVAVLRPDILVTTTDKGTYYRDLRGMVGANGELIGSDRLVHWKSAGVYIPALDRNNIQEVSRLDLLEDILKFNKLLPAAEIAKILATGRYMAASGIPKGSLGVDSHGAPDPSADIPKPSAFAITGTVVAPKAGGSNATAILYITLDSNPPTCRLYPKPGCNDVSPKEADVSGGDSATGPGTLNEELAADDRGFPPDGETADHHPLKLVLPRDKQAADAAGAALYVGQFQEGAPDKAVKKWFLRFRVQVKDAKKLSGPFFVFSDPASGRFLPPADISKVQLGGINLNKPLPSVNSVRVEPLDNNQDVPTDQHPSKGAVAVYDAPQGRDANCIGVVLWWGMDRGDALKQCSAKK